MVLCKNRQKNGSPSDKIIKNGRIHTEKPKCKCKNCSGQLVKNPVNRRLSDLTKQIIDKRL